MSEDKECFEDGTPKETYCTQCEKNVSVIFCGFCLEYECKECHWNFWD